MTNVKRSTNRKTREGKVISTSMDKTIVVNIQTLAQHAQYGKVLRKNKKIKVHAENSSCCVGDFVRVMETRPLSKTKRWRYIETIRKAVVV